MDDIKLAVDNAEKVHKGIMNDEIQQTLDTITDMLDEEKRPHIKTKWLEKKMR